MRFVALTFILALGLAGCQSAGTTAAAVKSSETAYPGSTMATAVVLPDATDEFSGVRAEHAYTDQHFPHARWSSQGLLNENGRVYDEINLVEDGKTKILYFDISNWFGKM